MLVAKNNRTLVLNLREPDRVLSIIPTAKTFEYRGRKLVAVPHANDEVRVLRNLGFDAPAPITYYYDWPGQQKPFAHQKHMAAFMSTNPRCFNLGDMGTGKTRAVLYAFDYLRRTGQVRKLLVVSPLSSLERTWGDEIFGNFPHLSFGVMHGTREHRLKVLAHDFDVYIINHDGIVQEPILKALLARKDLDVVALDEIATLRNASTRRWKAAKKLTENKTWVWGLTGTPTPNEPTDAWAQCRLVVPERVPKYFGRFREQVMVKVTPFKWVARQGANEEVAKAMHPSIRYARNDCIDLPPTTYKTYEVELSPEQKKLYADMMKRLKAEFEGGQLVAGNEAIKVNKLLQIVCGGGYSTVKADVVIPAPERVALVREIIDSAAAKVIVFVPIVVALEALAEELRRDYSVEVIHGQVSKTNRDRIFGSFQKEAHPRVLVAQPGTMSHSLTLTAADTIVWYAPITSNDTYEQANARIPRPGQKLNTLIAHIEGSEIERRLYDSLRGRSGRQGVLLDMFRDKVTNT
jgi:SNF2 family DNA or RNA helicase